MSRNICMINKPIPPIPLSQVSIFLWWPTTKMLTKSMFPHSTTRASGQNPWIGIYRTMFINHMDQTKRSQTALVFVVVVVGFFYPRPVLASGYCRCPCPSARPSVRHQVCPCDNSSPVQARITKFGSKMQNTLVKVPIVLGGNQPWPSRSNLSSKSKFTPFWASPHNNSSPIQARITKFGPEVQNTLVKIPIVLGGNWPRPSRSNLT